MFRASLAALLALLALGCARTPSGEVAIYDWEAQRAVASDHGARDLICKPGGCPDPRATRIYVLDAPKLSDDDFDHESARVGDDAQVGAPTVFLALTPSGQERFEALTSELAERGAERGEPQHLLLVVDDVVHSSPFIDYERFPDGLTGEAGVEISLRTKAEARELAKALREG